MSTMTTTTTRSKSLRLRTSVHSTSHRDTSYDPCHNYDVPSLNDRMAPHILTIPYEIRREIYLYIFTGARLTFDSEHLFNTNPTESNSPTSSSTQRSESEHLSASTPQAVLLTNHQIYAEGLPIYLSQLTIQLDCPLDVTELLPRLSITTRHNLTTLRASHSLRSFWGRSHHEFFNTQLSRLPSLKNLDLGVVHARLIGIKGWRLRQDWMREKSSVSNRVESNSNSSDFDSDGDYEIGLMRDYPLATLIMDALRWSTIGSVGPEFPINVFVTVACDIHSRQDWSDRHCVECHGLPFRFTSLFVNRKRVVKSYATEFDAVGVMHSLSNDREWVGMDPDRLESELNSEETCFRRCGRDHSLDQSCIEKMG